MKNASKPTPEAPINQTDQMAVGPASPSATGAAAAPPKKKAVVAKPKAALPVKAAKGKSRPPRASRAGSETNKLVCRYCGSDDLAPSFRKRRDARCRACFKQRYGAVARSNKSSRPRKATAAK